MEYRLLKDMPDLDAGATAEEGTDDQGNVILRIKSKNPQREDWFFFKDDIKNFDEWFEPIS